MASTTTGDATNEYHSVEDLSQEGCSNYSDWVRAERTDSFLSPVDSDDECCLSIADTESVSNTVPMVSKTTCVDADNGHSAPGRMPKNAKTAELSFHHITYEVNEKLNDVPCCGKWGKKEILTDIRL